jgi:polyferredoxin
VVGIFLSLGLVNLLGPGSFFKVAFLTIPFWLFVGILAVSIFAYRPFCRTACPYGVFLSMAASKSMFKIRRNDNCIDCGKCETVCPTGMAGRDDSKAECYLCNRCIDVCPVNALEYSKKK